MPRTFSTAIQGELNTQYGSEPLVIVEVEWSDGGSVAYSDRKLNDSDYPLPHIVEIGNFNTSAVVDGQSYSQNVSITLNDIDGSLKSIIDEQDIHLRPVKVYLGFQGLPLSEKALMFEGLIHSPITWSEGDRTLNFNIFSRLQALEVGFAMEDGDFPFVPPEDRGKAWPLIFGQVCNTETVQVGTLRKGILVGGQGVPDPTLQERLCQAQKLCCPENDAKAYIRGTHRVPITRPDGSIDVVTAIGVDDVINATYKAFPDAQCVARRFNTICRLHNDIEQQTKHFNDQITIQGGDKFPQNQTIKIRIENVSFEGEMDGNTFTISETFHPDSEKIDNPPCKEIAKQTLGFRTRTKYEGGKPVPPESCDDPDSIREGRKEEVNGPHESWDYFERFEAGEFIWLPPGSDVALDGDSDIVHIVSLIPGTVDRVSAYRTFDGISILTDLPTDLYTVHNINYGKYQAVEVRLTEQLSKIEDENWDDTIYVSFTSDIGPNPVDIIEWLLEEYTDITPDSTTSASVKTRLENYPCNFALKSRPNVLQLIQDIAFQSRCAVFVRDGTMFFSYLSEEPSSVRTLTEDDILTNTFQIQHTDTEELFTKHTIQWRKTEANSRREDDTELEFSLKHNIPKYGTREQSYNYYTQNTFETIEKSATFWLIRKSHTWKQVEFETTIKHLDLDVFDAFTLNIDDFPTVKCVITETDYDINRNTLRISAWTPILSGTNVPYVFAWPALQDVGLSFPESGSVFTGDGSNSNVIPPLGHPLRSGYDPNTARLSTAGEQHPSDLDDSFPSIDCLTSTASDIGSELPALIGVERPSLEDFIDLAQENFKTDLIERGRTKVDREDSEGDDITDNPSDSEEGLEQRIACGEPVAGYEDCFYEVYATYVTPNLVTTGFSDSSGCRSAGPCDNNASGGLPCTGELTEKCHSVRTLAGAKVLKKELQQKVDDLRNNCGYSSGSEDVYQVGVIKAVAPRTADVVCKDPNDDSDDGDGDSSDGDAGGSDGSGSVPDGESQNDTGPFTVTMEVGIRFEPDKCCTECTEGI